MAQKSLSHKTLIIAIGTGVQAILAQVAVNYFLVRIFDGPETFGIYRQTWLVVNTFLPIFTFGIPTSVYFYLSSLEERFTRSFIRRCTLLVLLFGMALGTGLYFLAPSVARLFGNAEVGPLIRAISPYVVFTVPAQLLFHFLIADDRVWRATIINTVVLVIQAALTVILIAKGMKLVPVFLILGAFSALRFVHAAWEMNRLTDGSPRARLPMNLMAHLRYAIPIGITPTVAIAGEKLDKFVIASYLDSATFGIYSVGALEFPAIILVYGAVANAIRSRMARFHHEGRPDHVYDLWKRAFRKTTLVLVPTAVFLAVYARELIELLYTTEYGSAAVVFRIYTILAIFRLMLFEPVLSSVGKTRTVFLGGVLFLLVDLALNLLFVNLMGLVGPPLATVLTTGLLAGYYGWHVSRHLQIPWIRLVPLPILFRLVGVAGVSALAVLPIKAQQWSHALSLLAGAGAYGLAYLVLGLVSRAVTRKDLSLGKI